MTTYLPFQTCKMGPYTHLMQTGSWVQCQNLLDVLHILTCSAFYEKEAMLMDPVDGPILASLLGIYELH